MTSEKEIELNTATETLVDLVVLLKERLGETKISKATIHIILKEAMEIVEEMNVPGSEKLDNVIRIVKTLINDFLEDREEKKLIMEIIDNNYLENTIELIVKASKGEININNKKTQKYIVSCFSITLRGILSLVKNCKSKKNKDVKILKN